MGYNIVCDCSRRKRFESLLINALQRIVFGTSVIDIIVSTFLNSLKSPSENFWFRSHGVYRKIVGIAIAVSWDMDILYVQCCILHINCKSVKNSFLTVHYLWRHNCLRIVYYRVRLSDNIPTGIIYVMLYVRYLNTRTIEIRAEYCKLFLKNRCVLFCYELFENWLFNYYE